MGESGYDNPINVDLACCTQQRISDEVLRYWEQDRVIAIRATCSARQEDTQHVQVLHEQLIDNG